MNLEMISTIQTNGDMSTNSPIIGRENIRSKVSGFNKKRLLGRNSAVINTINVAIKVCMTKAMIGLSIQWGRVLRILGSNRFAIRIPYKTKAKLLPTKVVDKKRARCL